jgi:hypothetical protein
LGKEIDFLGLEDGFCLLANSEPSVIEEKGEGFENGKFLWLE